MRGGNGRKKTVILCIILTTILLGIYLSGLLISEEKLAGNFLEAKFPPGVEHFFGTDALGRDLFFRTIKGLSASITIGLAASVISGIIAVCVGMIVATGSKKLDGMINWIIDLFMGVPHMVLILLISFALGRGMKGILAGIAFTHWCSLARLVRGEVLQLLSQPYIEISRKMGKSGIWIMINHILPHLAGQILAGLVLMFPHAILHEASISFLGFGLPPEEAAIGIILADSMRYITAGMWWTAVLPGLTLVFFVLMIDKLGNQLRRIWDPSSAQE